MELNNLADLINRSGFARLYKHESSYPKNNAQLNLEGRNHFASDNTLKSFGARINSAHPTASNLLFYIVESSFLDYQKTQRGFRYAVFDIFGTSIARLPADQAYKSSERCRKAMYGEINQFDVVQHYARTLESIARKADREASEARSICAQLTESEAIA